MIARGNSKRGSSLLRENIKRARTMKAIGLTAEQKKRLQFQRFKAISPSFTVANGSIYSFAINEVTSELLYADGRGIHLLAYRSNEELKSIPYTDLIKQEISRYSERKQQEILQTYSSHGVQYLNVIQTQNIWLGIISRKKFVFFSEELAVSNESPIDISGITCLKIHPETGDIFTLTGDGKVLMWGSEVISDPGKKRSSDFDVKIIMKKKFAVEGLIARFDVAWGRFNYVVGVGDNNQGGPAAVHMWDYSTGDKLPSLPHSEPSSILITAIGLRNTYLVLLDSAHNLAIHDLVDQCEVHKRNLGPTVSFVDSILIEENELNAGVYLIDSAGRVFDYSMTNAIMLSTYTHSKSKDRDHVPVASPRSLEKNYLAAMRSNQMDEKAAPGSIFSRFNTCYRIVTLNTGLTQLWALYDGTLNILSLASTGKVIEIGGVISRIRKFRPPAACPPQPPSSIMEVRMESGAIGLLDLSVDKQPKLQSGFLEVLRKRNEVPGICRITLDFTSVVSVSDSGGMLCYDYVAKEYSKDYQLSKIIVTALCLAPKYAMNGDEANGSNQLDIILGTDSGVILVFEYSPRTHLIESKKRYAGHDLVICLLYRPWDRRILTVGRDGYLKFLLCDRYYEWDAASFKGYWNDCTACAICGRAMVLMGYESGMLQTIYFSPTAKYPTSALLEYHTTNITSVCGLDLSLSEGVSGDSSGNMVLWNLETSEPLKIFTLYSSVDTLISFGTHKVESLYAVTHGSLVQLNVDRTVVYRKITKRDIAIYKAEAKKRRMDNRNKKTIRTGSLFMGKAKPTTARPTGTISDLYTRVSETKDRLLPDPVDAVRLKTTRVKTLDEELIVVETSGKTLDDRFKERALNQIIENNHVERFKKSLAITIKHCNQWVPRELMFNGKFKTKSLLVSPSQSQSHLPSMPKTAYPGKALRKSTSDPPLDPDESSTVYMTRSLSHTMKSFPHTASQPRFSRSIFL